MTSKVGTGVGRLVVELGVVVLGVLIALAADSWWEDRKDQARATAYLVAIAADMEAGRESLRRTHEATVERSELFARFFGWVSSDLPYPDTLSEPPRRGLQVTSLPLGTLDALVTTGDINLITDPELRAILLREQRTLRNYHQLWWAEVDQWGEIFEGWVYSLQEFRVTGRPTEGAGFSEAVRADAVMSGHYMNFLGVLGQRAGVEQDLLEAMTNVQEAIGAALGT